MSPTTRFRLALLLAVLLGGRLAGAHEAGAGTLHYLGNSGVMIAAGETKVIIDPLFRNDYGQYELVPAELERALVAGEPPWDGVDVILKSSLVESSVGSSSRAWSTASVVASVPVKKPLTPIAARNPLESSLNAISRPVDACSTN